MGLFGTLSFSDARLSVHIEEEKEAMKESEGEGTHLSMRGGQK